jgi:hypothetical protein
MGKYARGLGEGDKAARVAGTNRHAASKRKRLPVGVAGFRLRKHDYAQVLDRINKIDRTKRHTAVFNRGDNHFQLLFHNGISDCGMSGCKRE